MDDLAYRCTVSSVSTHNYESRRYSLLLVLMWTVTADACLSGISPSNAAHPVRQFALVVKTAAERASASLDGHSQS